jgi:DNA-binding GntR family transcriptional regulator
VSRPRRGTFVTRLSPEDALNFGITRALLEAFAVRIGIQQLDEKLFAQLEGLIVEMSTCRLPDDVPRLVQLDLGFHQRLVATGRSTPIEELWSSLNGQIRAMYFTTLENEHATIDYVVAFHRQLLEQLRTGAPQAIQQAVIQHYVRDPAQVQVIAAHETIDRLAPVLLARAGTSRGPG